LNAPEISINNRGLGSFESSIFQNGVGIAFAGKHKGLLLPDNEISLDGNIGIDKKSGFFSSINFRRPESLLKLESKDFLPGQNMVFEGNVFFAGNMSMANGKIKSSVKTKVKDAKIEFPEKSIMMEGVDLDLNIIDILKLQSPPKQSFRFKRFAMGDIETGKGRIDFQIESLKSLLIEKSDFEWCDGHISTHELRITSGKKDFDLVLYCNDMELSKLLSQFKALKMEGKGTLSGRIPLQIKNGKIFFVNGLLSTTPGKSGVIILKDASQLTGEGKVSSQDKNLSMDITREALKKFNYDWAKLYLTSDENDVLLRLQVSGRPDRLLSFGYDKETGLYYTEEGKWKANFQGIEFDIHLNVPLDRLLKYGKLWKKE
jgi:hypothetical protein